MADRKITKEVSVLQRDPASVLESVTTLLNELAAEYPGALVTDLSLITQNRILGTYFLSVKADPAPEQS